MNYPRQPAKELSLPTRLPLVAPLAQRGTRILADGQDSRLINAYVEIGEDGEPNVVKRPGLAVWATRTGKTVGLGAAFISGALMEIWGDGSSTATLYINGSISGTVAADSIPVVGGFYPYTFSVVSFSDNFLVRIQSPKRNYIYNAGVTEILPRGDSLGTFSGTLTAGSPVISVPDTTGITKYSGVYGTGILPDTLVQSINSATSLTLTNNSTITGASSLNIVRSGPLFPSDQSTGQCAFLDRVSYLISRFSGQIVGSDVNDPYAYDPLNSIYALNTADTPVYLAEQSSHIIVFKQKSVEFFRTSGNPAGSTLASVRGMKLDIGCNAAETVQQINGVLFWRSNSGTSEDSIWMMEGLRAQDIGTPAIRRLLVGTAGGKSMSFSISGHTFYLLRLYASGPAIVYDVETKLWYVWTAFGDNDFPFVAAVRHNTLDEVYFQHESNGKMYRMDPFYYSDDGAEITMDIFPPEFDGGLSKGKFLSKMYVVADQEAGSSLYLRVSDDNQTTWTKWRQFDLGHTRPMLDNCGTFTKRAFQFRHIDKTPCRVRWVELELYPGVI